MISGTRYYRNPDLFVSDEDAARTAAFIEADIKHKEDPTSVRDLLPVPRIKYPEAEKPQLFNLADDPGEKNDLADAHWDRLRALSSCIVFWSSSSRGSRRSKQTASRSTTHCTDHPVQGWGEAQRSVAPLAG